MKQGTPQTYAVLKWLRANNMISAMRLVEIETGCYDLSHSLTQKSLEEIERLSHHLEPAPSATNQTQNSADDLKNAFLTLRGLILDGEWRSVEETLHYCVLTCAGYTHGSNETVIKIHPQIPGCEGLWEVMMYILRRQQVAEMLWHGGVEHTQEKTRKLLSRSYRRHIMLRKHDIVVDENAYVTNNGIYTDKLEIPYHVSDNSFAWRHGYALGSYWRTFDDSHRSISDNLAEMSQKLDRSGLYNRPSEQINGNDDNIDDEDDTDDATRAFVSCVVQALRELKTFVVAADGKTLSEAIRNLSFPIPNSLPDFELVCASVVEDLPMNASESGNSNTENSINTFPNWLYQKRMAVCDMILECILLILQCRGEEAVQERVFGNTMKMTGEMTGEMPGEMTGEMTGEMQQVEDNQGYPAEDDDEGAANDIDAHAIDNEAVEDEADGLTDGNRDTYASEHTVSANRDRHVSDMDDEARALNSADGGYDAESAHMDAEGADIEEDAYAEEDEDEDGVDSYAQPFARTLGLPAARATVVADEYVDQEAGEDEEADVEGGDDVEGADDTAGVAAAMEDEEDVEDDNRGDHRDDENANIEDGDEVDEANIAGGDAGRGVKMEANVDPDDYVHVAAEDPVQHLPVRELGGAPAQDREFTATLTQTHGNEEDLEDVARRTSQEDDHMCREEAPESDGEVDTRNVFSSIDAFEARLMAKENMVRGEVATKTDRTATKITNTPTTRTGGASIPVEAEVLVVDDASTLAAEERTHEGYREAVQRDHEDARGDREDEVSDYDEHNDPEYASRNKQQVSSHVDLVHQTQDEEKARQALGDKSPYMGHHVNSVALTPAAATNTSSASNLDVLPSALSPPPPPVTLWQAPTPIRALALLSPYNNCRQEEKESDGMYLFAGSNARTLMSSSIVKNHIIDGNTKATNANYGISAANTHEYSKYHLGSIYALAICDLEKANTVPHTDNTKTDAKEYTRILACASNHPMVKLTQMHLVAAEAAAEPTTGSLLHPSVTESMSKLSPGLTTMLCGHTGTVRHIEPLLHPRYLPSLTSPAKGNNLTTNNAHHTHLLTSGAGDNIVRQWNLAKCAWDKEGSKGGNLTSELDACECHYKGHTGTVYSVVTDGRYVVTGAADKTLCIFPRYIDEEDRNEASADAKVNASAKKTGKTGKRVIPVVSPLFRIHVPSPISALCYLSSMVCIGLATGEIISINMSSILKYLASTPQDTIPTADQLKNSKNSKETKEPQKKPQPSQPVTLEIDGKGVLYRVSNGARVGTQTVPAESDANAVSGAGRMDYVAWISSLQDDIRCISRADEEHVLAGGFSGLICLIHARSGQIRGFIDTNNGVSHVIPENKDAESPISDDAPSIDIYRCIQTHNRAYADYHSTPVPHDFENAASLPLHPLPVCGGEKITCVRWLSGDPSLLSQSRAVVAVASVNKHVLGYYW